jgi:hypothetical protein
MTKMYTIVHMVGYGEIWNVKVGLRPLTVSPRPYHAPLGERLDWVSRVRSPLVGDCARFAALAKELTAADRSSPGIERPRVFGLRSAPLRLEAAVVSHPRSVFILSSFVT